MATSTPESSQMGSIAGERQHDSASSKGSLLNLPFLKNFGDKKTTKDGRPPKRRGPKPDSKPALTRRQELNRQAQRTHRERKEHYIRALEQELLRLKESFTTTTQEKNAVAEENRILRELLRQHGIPVHQASLTPSATPSLVRDTSSNGFGGSSNGTTNYAHSQGLSSPPSRGPSQPPVQGGQAPQQNIDYDQAGIDFVLTLERPCMDHMPFLGTWSGQSEDNVFGHALMATCPSEDHILHHSDEPYPLKTWDLQKPDLKILLDLSAKLDLDGEITPVMAWGMILAHERFHELTLTDFAAILEDLKSKVRCYGFGAVLEEFEVRDALSSVFATKLESYAVFK